MCAPSYVLMRFCHLINHPFVCQAKEGCHIRITIISWDHLNLLLTSHYQLKLSSITNVAPGGSANQIAVFTSNLKIIFG